MEATLLKPRFEPYTLEGLSPKEMQAIMQGVRGGYGVSRLLNDPPVVAINNNTFTTARDITSSTTQPPWNINAYYFQQGDVIRTHASGTFSTTGTPTLIFGTYYGATALAVNSALTTASNAATLPWTLETMTTVVAAGSSGKMSTEGFLRYGTSLTAVTTIPVPAIALADVTVNTTTAALWTVMATWSASSASNIVITRHFFIEHLNFPV